jgi:hypothetical protein
MHTTSRTFLNSQWTLPSQDKQVHFPNLYWVWIWVWPPCSSGPQDSIYFWVGVYKGDLLTSTNHLSFFWSPVVQGQLPGGNGPPPIYFFVPTGEIQRDKLTALTSQYHVPSHFMPWNMLGSESWAKTQNWCLRLFCPYPCQSDLDIQGISTDWTRQTKNRGPWSLSKKLSGKNGPEMQLFGTSLSIPETSNIHLLTQALEEEIQDLLNLPWG